jgi:hypothetical protein
MKASYAGHQLQGPAGIWWNHHRTTFPANVEVVWDQFKEAFRVQFIPPGLMAIKHTEFMKLTQGNKSLTEYLQAFNNLVRYAPEFVDTNAKKIASFKKGLSPKLMRSMGNSKCVTFNEFISDALTQGNNDKVYAASKTRKRNFEADASQSKTPVVSKTQYRSPTANVRYRQPQKKNTSGQGSSNVPPANRLCWNCNKPGHWANNCPYPPKQNA